MPRISTARASVLRTLLVLLLVVAFSTALWFASPAPVRAVDINVTNPASGTLGSAYSFSIRVDINDADLLPVQSVDLRIYKAVDTGIYAVLFTGLPLPSLANTTESRSYSGAGGSAFISGTTGPVWGRAQDTRYGYGYAYQSGTWETIDLGFGYGYGYSSGGDHTGTAYIDYSVAWVPPAGWPETTYRIQAIVYGTDGDAAGAFTNDAVAQFSLAAPVIPPAGGGTPGGSTPLVDADHKFTDNFTIQSADSQLTLDIAAGTVGETAAGGPLTDISVTLLADPPDPPAETNRVALVYELGPDGARFPGGITLTMTYDPAALEGGSLVMAYWDGSAWVDLAGPFTIDAAAHTISTTIYHFTPFTVLESVSPAAFVATGLVISPDEVEIGEETVISFTLANTGDLSGAYELILLVNGAAVESLTANLDGHESLEVTFTPSWDVAGTYTISVAGLSGTVTVKALPATPTPTPSVTPSPTPSPTPVATPTLTPTPTPTPSPTPTLGEPDEGGLSWWIYVIVAAAVVIFSAATLLLYRRRRA